MTCTSDLIRKMFEEKKFMAARTKTKDIAVNVIAPYAVQLIKCELEKAKFVSILVDASNHKAIKLVPVIVRYFSTTTGVKNKVLEFSNLPGETAELIHSHIMKVVNNFDLKNKMISFSADNTNTNFGGIQRKGKNNVFIKLKKSLDRNILGMGCFAHIIHNAIQQAADSLPIDVESIVCKIFSFFHIYTVREESSKEFCDFADVQYNELLSHSKTRWLSLYPAIDRIISIYNGLKSYFLSQNICPNVLKCFFENETSLLWLKFLSCQLKIITCYIKKIESQNLSAIEIMIVVENLLNIINNKREEKFLTTEVENLINTLEDEGQITKQDFDSKCDNFYDIFHNYVCNWSESNEHNSELKKLLWVTLTPKKIVTWSNVNNSTTFITSTCNSICIDENNYFEQFKVFEKYFSEQSEEWHKISLEERWLLTFKHFKELNIEFNILLMVVEFFFTLPGSNAAVECVFSLMNSTWTKCRNKLDISTVEASLIIKTNFDGMSCGQFFEKILLNKTLLQKVHSSAKYKTTQNTRPIDNLSDTD